MSNITKILVEDIKNVLANTRESLQPLVYFARGLYAPAVITSEFTRAKREYETPMPQSDGFACGIGLGLIEPVAAFSSTLILGTIAHEKGMLKEYIAALVITNVLDYSLNLRKRSHR